VRKRPLNAQEKKTKQYDVVTTIPSEDWGARCVVHEPKKKVKQPCPHPATIHLCGYRETCSVVSDGE